MAHPKFWFPDCFTIQLDTSRKTPWPGAAPFRLLQRYGRARTAVLCITAKSAAERQLWFIHVIPAIPACPVSPQERTFLRAMRDVIPDVTESDARGNQVGAAAGAAPGAAPAASRSPLIPARRDIDSRPPAEPTLVAAARPASASWVSGKKLVDRLSTKSNVELGKSAQSARPAQPNRAS